MIIESLRTDIATLRCASYDPAAIVPHGVRRADGALTVNVPGLYAPNTEIYAQGEASGSLYQVVSGAVRACRLLSDGRRQISAFYLPGDVFGLEGDDHHHLSAEAVVRSRVRTVRLGRFTDLIARHDAAAIELWQVAISSLMRTQDHLLLLGRRNALERVAAFLLEMADRQGASTVDLPMTRLDIADYLGLTLETVSRMFAQLKDSGVIALPSARCVQLLDRLLLETMSA